MFTVDNGCMFTVLINVLKMLLDEKKKKKNGWQVNSLNYTLSLYFHYFMPHTRFKRVTQISVPCGPPKHVIHKQLHANAYMLRHKWTSKNAKKRTLGLAQLKIYYDSEVI